MKKSELGARILVAGINVALNMLIVKMDEDINRSIAKEIRDADNDDEILEILNEHSQDWRIADGLWF